MGLAALLVVLCWFMATASSHREAPLIAKDPLADNTDVYAFRSPDDPNTVTIIANYIPMQLPHGGPNYYHFGDHVVYEIHIDNDAATPGDDIVYRFTFTRENEDPTTFFNIRLGAENIATTYTMERSMDGGMTFQTVITDGETPPYNVGPRSIEGAAGLGTTYDQLFEGAITTAPSGEKVFAGPVEDPFFVDLGGIFDLGDAPRQNGQPRDGLTCFNVHTIAMQIPISMLLKDGAPAQPTSILDSDYIIGVWASASRTAMRTFGDDGTVSYSGDLVQISRLGMPLTNEAVIAVGDKDYWNSLTPYEEFNETSLDPYFYNPELALYMDEDFFASAVPAFAPLRIQTNSLGMFDFSNGADGLFGLKGAPALDGTALSEDAFGALLLPGPGQPRSVDLWPIFHTGVPNLPPYQLATGKDGNPLAAGKPFINNFLPNGGDMLRLNMAVPVTPRDDANFSSLGLLQAAVLGLTDPTYAGSADLQFIPNMDGFPNGRRLEDDVTRIELQAVSGIVLAAIGLWYDDYDPATSPSPVTDDLLGVLGYTTGVEKNDIPFSATFPYENMPYSGTGPCSGALVDLDGGATAGGNGGVVQAQLYVSSNTSGRVGVFNILQGNDDVQASSFGVAADDADGIYYDADSDRLYQLNRTDNRIDVYTNVANALAGGNTPTLAYSSTSDFSNGREIAVSGDRLVVAQDASSDNGMQNRLIVYTLGDDNITLANSFDVDFNLWGIDANGETLYAIEDNSSNLRIFNDFFDNSGSSVSSDATVAVAGIVRTHGLTYYGASDLMILTDVGDGGSPTDGAIVTVMNFSDAISDGTIAANEQLRIAGSNTFLGNPVDVAYDAANQTIYTTERANAGGRILGFNLTDEGNVAPSYDQAFAGASGLFLNDNCDEVVVDNGGGNNGGGDPNSADLELTASVTPTSVPIYTNATFVLTLTNNGGAIATNVKVSAPLPDGFVNTSNSTTAGNYNLFFEEWTVPVLAPGASAELTLVLFALEQNSAKMFSEVIASDQPDPDSTPNNGDGVTPQEDDETAATITVTSIVDNDDDQQQIQAAAITPNVISTGENIQLRTQSTTPSVGTVRILDNNGGVVQQRAIELSEGADNQRLRTKALPAGIYLVQVQLAGQLPTTQRLIVQ